MHKLGRMSHKKTNNNNKKKKTNKLISTYKGFGRSKLEFV